MSKKLNLKLFSKYYWGIATDEEKTVVYNSDESNSMLNRQWDDFTDQKSLHTELNHEKITLEIKSRIAKPQKIKRINKLGSFILKHAASIFIPLLAIGTLYFLLVMRPGMVNNMAQVEKTTLNGQRSEVVLPDGSIVWLNAETKISFPEKFIGKYRIINLEGEAYFKVVKNPKKPFIVKTDKLDIEVLGTSFNVSSYSNDKFVETTLVTGKVSVRRFNPETNKAQKAILTPGHQALFCKDQEQFILDQVDVNKFTSWKQGIITFDNEPLLNMSNVLERWYNVNIKIDDELKGQYNYTITITDESLEEVLALIKKTTPKVKIKRTDNIIELSYN